MKLSSIKLSSLLCSLDSAVAQATFEKLENEMKEINSNAETLKRNFLDLTELKHILRKTQSFFDEVRSAFTSCNSKVR